MNPKILIIYQNDVLFNILNELYSDEFKIIFLDEKNSNNLKPNEIDNSLVVSDDENIKFKNRLVIKEFPLNIKKLI